MSREHFAADEHDVGARRTFKLGGGNAGELVAQLARRPGARCRRRRRRSGWSSCRRRPTTHPSCVSNSTLTATFIRLETEHVGHDLGAARCGGPGPAGAEAMMTLTPPSGSMVTRGGGDRAVLRAGLGARLRRHHGRDVAHVRNRGLDDGRETDAVQPALGACALALARQQPAPDPPSLDAPAPVQAGSRRSRSARPRRPDRETHRRE